MQIDVTGVWLYGVFSCKRQQGQIYTLLSDHESNEFPVTVNLFLMSFYTSIKMRCHVMNAHVCCMSHHQSCD